MKAFNLELALAGYPVVTGDGEKAINIFATNGNDRFNVSVLTKASDDDCSSVSHGWYSKEGEHMGLDRFAESKRLFMADIDHKITAIEINLYEDQNRNLLVSHEGNNFVINRKNINVNLSIDDVKFTARTANALWNAGKRTLKDLIAMNKEDVENIPSIGKKSLAEIIEELSSRRLSLSNGNKLNFIKTISFTVEE